MPENHFSSAEHNLLDEHHRIAAGGIVGGKEFFWRVAKGESREQSEVDPPPTDTFVLRHQDAERVAAAMASRGGAPVQEP